MGVKRKRSDKAADEVSHTKHQANHHRSDLVQCDMSKLPHLHRSATSSRSSIPDHIEQSGEPKAPAGQRKKAVNGNKPTKATEDIAAARDGEKRLRRFRSKAPRAYHNILERANTQRMFVVDRERKPHPTAACQTEEISLAGSTGNIYTITITHIPTCTCPSFLKGTAPCKHIAHVLVKVLKAAEYLQYQQALLSSELRDIFQHAGSPLISEQIEVQDTKGKRRPCEGECPICCENMSIDGEETVWCRAGCGNNLHKQCFDTWAASKKGGRVTCPYCRTPWQTHDGDLRAVAESGRLGPEGYVNIADQLGISKDRDYSTYNGYWVRGQARDGRVRDARGFDGHLARYGNRGHGVVNQSAFT